MEAKDFRNDPVNACEIMLNIKIPLAGYTLRQT